jgi:hypothetical protein
MSHADATVSNVAIFQINSLGGPELPTGLSFAELRVVLENRRAADSPFGSVMAASQMAAQ